HVTGAEHVALVDLLLLALGARYLGGGVIDALDPAHGGVHRGPVAEVAPRPLEIQAAQGLVVAVALGEHAHHLALGEKPPDQVCAKVPAAPGRENAHRPSTVRPRGSGHVARPLVPYRRSCRQARCRPPAVGLAALGAPHALSTPPG